MSTVAVSTAATCVLDIGGSGFAADLRRVLAAITWQNLVETLAAGEVPLPL